MTGRADLVLLDGFLLVLAWLAIWMWWGAKPPHHLLIVAIVPVVFATGLGVWVSVAIKPTETDLINTFYACLAAVVVPCAVMLCHLASVFERVLPGARTVRRRQR